MAQVKVYFVTNRNYRPDSPERFGPRFNKDGVAALRFGHAVMDISSNPPTLVDMFVYPDAYVLKNDTSLPAEGSGHFLEDIRIEMAAGRDTMVYIHGFNVSFLEALADAALVAREIPAEINVVLFSWPSDGTMIPYMSYYSDRDDARASGPALARTYLKLFDFVRELRAQELRTQLEETGGVQRYESALCQRCIHILAHSMGVYVLRHGLQAVDRKDRNKLVRLFDQVILAAADEDYDAFELEDKLGLLPTLSRRITVYHNRYDRALVISDTTKANPDRLGAEGPRLADMLPRKVILVDCSRIAPAADPRSLHSYYINSPSLAVDMGSVLKDEEDEEIVNRDRIRPERAYRIKG